MSKLKLKYKNKKVNKEVKQKPRKNNPFNLIDVYFAITKKMFKVKNINIKTREDQDVRIKTNF